MKRLLLATVAASGLLFAPIAAAQYTAPPAPPVTTPDTSANESTSPEGTAEAPVTSTNPTSPGLGTTTTPTPSATTQAQTTTTAPSSVTTAQSAAPGPYGPVTAPPTYQGQPATTASTAAPTMSDSAATAAPSYAQSPTPSATTASTTATAQPATYQSAEDALAVAQDAGMEAVPMTAQAVCAPRLVSLDTSEYSRTLTAKVENAVDHASVCDVQEVVIQGAGSRANSIERTLIARGVDEASIRVEPTADAEGAGVRMTFAGVATSSEQYAQVFNAPQLAYNAPAATPSAAQPSPSAPSYGPSPSSPSFDDSTRDDPGAMQDPAPETAPETAPEMADEPSTEL